jgi:hypothetical protein
MNFPEIVSRAGWLVARKALLARESTWLITHEHASVPFYMDGSVRAAVDLKTVLSQVIRPAARSDRSSVAPRDRGARRPQRQGDSGGGPRV